MILHHSGFPIRKSADRSLFTAPRSLSQLVTSFIGSWCQGIHLMLFIAWTLFCFVLYKLLFAIYCLSFVSIIFSLGLLLSIVKKLCFLIFEFFHLGISTLANCSYPRFLERPFCYWLKLIFILKTVFLNYLFVLLYLLYSVFNEHLRAKHFCVLLVGSNGLEPSTSRLSGARSSHLSYEPM